MFHKIRKRADWLHEPLDQRQGGATHVLQSSSAVMHRYPSLTANTFTLEPTLRCTVRNDTHTNLYFSRHTFRKIGVIDDGNCSNFGVGEEEEEEEEEEQVIVGGSMHSQRELRTGVMTSDSSSHRAHRLQLRMDGYMPTAVDIGNMGTFPINLRPKLVVPLRPDELDADRCNRSITLICEVAIAGGHTHSAKTVTIRSPVVLRNSSSTALDVKFGDHVVPGE
jgi:hypothetical protein